MMRIISRMRHTPPTAVPIHIRDLWRGLQALSDPQDTLRNFQKAISTYIGASHCYLTSSGRASLYLILQALRRLSERTHVIVPAYTCPTVAQAVMKAGLHVRLCDLSLDTLGLNREELAKLIDNSVLAIVAVHPFGLLEDMTDLIALGQQMGIYIIEDGAQSLGARLDERMVGSWGDVGLFSLGRSKAMTTGGGGIIVTSNDIIATSIQEALVNESAAISKTGLSSLAFLASYRLATHPLGWWFIIQGPLNPAESSRKQPLPFTVGQLSGCQAGVGISMLSFLDEINQVRRRNAERLVNALKDLPFVRFPSLVPNADPIYLRLPALVSDKESRERLFQRLHHNGIGVSRMYLVPLAELYANRVNQNGEAFSTAKLISNHLLTLPTHHLMTERELRKTIKIFCDGLN